MQTYLFISLYPLPEVQFVEEEWVGAGGVVVVVGALVITPWQCYSVELCRTVTLSQKYIWQERTRKGEGRMET